MLDKRAVGNTQLYESLEKQIQDIVKRIDYKKAKEENESVIDAIGCCPVTQLDVIEAIEQGDCMCLGLNVERPEAAIADPSRLIIKQIIPTFCTADAFMQSALFNLKKGEDAAHGGFKDKGGYKRKVG